MTAFVVVVVDEPKCPKQNRDEKFNATNEQRNMGKPTPGVGDLVLIAYVQRPLIYAHNDVSSYSRGLHFGLSSSIIITIMCASSKAQIRCSTHYPIIVVHVC